MIQDCTQNPPVNGPPFQVTPVPQAPAASAFAPANAPAPPGLPFPGFLPVAPVPAPALAHLPPPAAFPAPRPAPVAGQRRQHEEDDEKNDDSEDSSRPPKRARFNNPYNPAHRAGPVSRDSPSPPPPDPTNQRSAAVERLRQELQQNPASNQSQPGPSGTNSRRSLSSHRRVNPASSFATPGALQLPSAQVGNLNPFQAIQRPQDARDEPMQDDGFQAPDFIERFAQWSLSGAPAHSENQSIADAPTRVGTQLYPFTERPLIGDNSFLYRPGHPEYVNSMLLRESLRAADYPGKLPLQTIPTERIPNDQPAVGQCQEPLRKVRNAQGEFLEICSKATQHVCEDRRHPFVEDGVDQRWYISDDCNDFSKLVITKEPNGLNKGDIMG